MGLVELHDALTVPAAVRRWARIAVEQANAMATTGECDGAEQSGGSGADGHDVHSTSFHFVLLSV